MTRYCSSILLLSSLLSSASAFTAPRPASRLSTLPLNVGAALDWNTNDERSIMERAFDCANSDSCSLDDAQVCLDDVIHIQSGCVSGALLGSDVCNNVDTTAEVVANLRVKIDQETRRVSVLNAGSNVISLSLAVVLLSVFAAGAVAVNPEVSPFTPQELWWAIRDGYLPTLLEHYFRHGGLAIADSYEPESTPFVLQEWWFAMKGGYLNTMVDHFVRNGGLATAGDYQLASSPITPQEWQFSVQGGYFDQLVAENVQHGGLAGNNLESDVLPLTPQEWLWAAKGGYLNTAAEHYFRNGGL
jgi:hypothetical protein